MNAIPFVLDGSGFKLEDGPLKGVSGMGTVVGEFLSFPVWSENGVIAVTYKRTERKTDHGLTIFVFDSEEEK